MRDPTLTWDGISWLKTITNLPIIVKGILHPEDAILAVKQGVKGTLVIFKYLKPCTVVYRSTLLCSILISFEPGNF